MKKLFIFGDSYSDWCNKDVESPQNGETLRQEDFWFQKLADYKNLQLWNYGRSGYGAAGTFREFMAVVDEINENDLVIFGLSWWERFEIHGIGFGYNHNVMGSHCNIRTKNQLEHSLKSTDPNTSDLDFWGGVFNISMYNYVEELEKASKNSDSEDGLLHHEHERAKRFANNVCEVMRDRNLNVKFWTLPEIPDGVTPYVWKNLIEFEGMDSTFDWLLKNLRYIVGGPDGDIDWHFNRKGHEKFFHMIKDKV
tara:strand:+ start:1185 stop:1940 length:756 start_codon:yes stop_codon:yes gene_type:complete